MLGDRAIGFCVSGLRRDDIAVIWPLGESVWILGGLAGPDDTDLADELANNLHPVSKIE